MAGGGPRHAKFVPWLVRLSFLWRAIHDRQIGGPIFRVYYLYWAITGALEQQAGETIQLD